MIKTKFVFAVSLVAILAVSSSMAASVTDVAPATGEGQAISGTTGTVGDVYDWSKWSGYATEGIASVNYVNNAVDAAGNAAQWAENHAAAAGTAAKVAEGAAETAKAWATDAKNTLEDKQDKRTAVKVTTSGTEVGSATVPVYVNSSGVATPITSYSGNAASATKATQDGNGKVIADTYATKDVVNNLSQEVNGISAKYDNLNSDQTKISSRLDGVEQDIIDLVDTKVDIDQGSTNANKIMITNASGGVAPVAITDSGNGSLVTGVSITDGKLTVTKGSSLPTVNNATLTIKKNGTTVDTFTANSSANKTIDITVPTGALASKNTITNADVADTAAIAQSKISGLTDALGGKQETITDLATIRSGAEAGATALQKADITTGTSNGTISVDGTNVAVKGLGTAAYTASTAYATAAQGTLASSAVQPEDLAEVATSGSYNDLSNKPTIPTVNNATLTIKNGATNTNLATFTANQSSAATATIPAATPSVAGLSKIGVIPSGSATSTTYATIWVE